MVIYGIHFELRFFRFYIKSWPEWWSNPRPRTYRALAERSYTFAGTNEPKSAQQAKQRA